MADGKRKLLILLIGLMIAANWIVGSQIDPASRRMNKTSSNGQRNELMMQLPGQFLVATFTGFKEVVAGTLWVRADTFFHSGQYDAIMPIVRLVTWLDPHNLDVFTTGAWHLDYNFVDKNEMSDKRYIPCSIALLKEGVAANPNIWDLYFELGWTHYNRKLCDFVSGLKYMKMACEHDGIDENTGMTVPRPAYVDRMLAHQYEKVGDFEGAIKQWNRAIERSKVLMKDKRDTTSDASALDICYRNLGLLYLRLGWRYGNMDYYHKGVEIYKQLAAEKGAPPDVGEAAKGAEADYLMRLKTHKPPSDALKPIDVKFNIHMVKLGPKKFKLVGTVNLISIEEFKGLASESVTHLYANNLKLPPDKRKVWVDNIKITWRLQDLDYKMPDLDTFDWKIDKNKMVVWDNMPIIEGKLFSFPVDLSVDKSFYPFKADKYKLTVWISPIEPSCDDTMQDRLGWKGEAFSGKYIDTKFIPGVRCIKVEKILTRDQLL